MKFFVLASLLGLLACSSSKKEPELSPEPILPKPKANVAEEDNFGSLWRGEATVGSFFLDTKANRVGDILTVIILEETNASNQASTDLGRESEVEADVSAFGGFRKAWNKVPWGLLKGVTPSVGASSKNDFMGNGATRRSENLEARISVNIVEVQPTGNFVIEGQREIKINNEKQILKLRGLVRPPDIRIDNTVLSSFVADAHIEYIGSGVISDKQRPGWLSRIVDWIWPF